MLSPDQVRRALVVVTTRAVTKAQAEIDSDPRATRARLREAVPQVVADYSLGAAALAVDYYDERREAVRPPRPYRAEPVVDLRAERLRRGLLWSVEPLWGASDVALSRARIAEVVQLETARAYRQTITTNAQRDPSSLGWRRVTSGSGCKFCQMLASRGAVYRADTARFAAHSNCSCSASPVFEGEDVGEPASALQYEASQKRRSEADRKRLRKHLNENYPDAPG